MRSSFLASARSLRRFASARASAACCLVSRASSSSALASCWAAFFSASAAAASRAFLSSAAFARLLGREAKPRMPTKDNFHRMASLMVLKAPDMPSVLFETGYISNPDDAAFLDSRDGREAIAESVRRAVEVHFARRMAAR